MADVVEAKTDGAEAEKKKEAAKKKSERVAIRTEEKVDPSTDEVTQAAEKQKAPPAADASSLQFGE